MEKMITRKIKVYTYEVSRVENDELIKEEIETYQLGQFTQKWKLENKVADVKLLREHTVLCAVPRSKFVEMSNVYGYTLAVSNSEQEEN